MTITTDGREIVWLVFVADGYECADFDSAFGSQQEAETHAEELRVNLAAGWLDMWKDWPEREHIDRRMVEVLGVELGLQRTPEGK